MDSTRDTVLRLSVKLWESVTFVDASFLNISNSSLLNNVPYDKSLNRLVLGATLSTVGTPDWFHMTTVMLVPATIPALESHHVLKRLLYYVPNKLFHLHFFSQAEIKRNQ
jgi:hypothetical protein